MLLNFINVPSITEWLLSVLKNIPLINSVFEFPWRSHKVALIKFSALWVLSTSPVILAILLSDVPPGNDSVGEKFLDRIGGAFSISEQFVYAASFLSPVIYIIIERYVSASGEKKLQAAFKGIFRGYGWVLTLALVLLVVTMLAYSATKVSSSGFEKSFLYRFVADGALWFYVGALFCWYLSILDGFGVTGDFVEENRRQEEGLKKTFSDRLRERASK